MAFFLLDWFFMAQKIDLDEQIGARLQAARQAARLTRAQVHQTLGDGFGASTVQAHETGRNALRPAVIVQYCTLYNVSYSYLLDGSGPSRITQDELNTIVRGLGESDSLRNWLAIGRQLSETRLTPD